MEKIKKKLNENNLIQKQNNYKEKKEHKTKQLIGKKQLYKEKMEKLEHIIFQPLRKIMIQNLYQKFI